MQIIGLKMTIIITVLILKTISKYIKLIEFFKAGANSQYLIQSKKSKTNGYY